MSIKCSVCHKEGVTYGYYGFNLCPKCNGNFRDTKIPDHIPTEQWLQYKLLIIGKKFSENHR